jgi:hypothetical protein
MGVYKLNEDVISELKKYTPLQPSLHTDQSKLTFATDTFQCLGSDVVTDASMDYRYMLKGEYIYQGKGTPQKPEIGDYKFVYWAIEPALYSIIAQQHADFLQAKPMKDGFAISELNCGINLNYQKNKFLLIKSGKNDTSEMYEWAHHNNDILFVFGLRGFGLLFMIGGFVALFYPFAFILSWMPVVGKKARKVAFRLGFLVGTTVTFFISGTAWLMYNNVDNLTKWDLYFVLLACFIMLTANSVKSTMKLGPIDRIDSYTP